MEPHQSPNSSQKWNPKGMLAHRILQGSHTAACLICLLASQIKIRQHKLVDSLKRSLQPTQNPLKISFLFLAILHWIAEALAEADRLMARVEEFVQRANGFLTFPLLQFEGGRRFVQAFPGAEMAIALCASFGKLRLALEIAVRDVANHSAIAVSAIVCHRYGKEASEAVYTILAIFGHVMSVGWICLQVLDPISLPLIEIEIEPCHEIYLEDPSDEHPKAASDKKELYAKKIGVGVCTKCFGYQSMSRVCGYAFQPRWRCACKKS